MNRGKDYIRRATRMDGSLDVERLVNIINTGFELAVITEERSKVYFMALWEIFRYGGRKDRKTGILRDYEWIRSVAGAALDGKPLKNETVPAGTGTESNG